MLTGTVWAGAIIVPGNATLDGATDLIPGAVDSASGGPDAVASLGSDAIMVGAKAISLEPRPADFGGTWVTDRDKCVTAPPLAPQDGNLEESMAHAADWRSPWIENTNCIYMGGFGLGPENPVTGWDPTYGLYVRTTVFVDAQGDMVSTTLVDAEGYFSAYNKMCGPMEPNCGSQAISEDIATELGLPSGHGIVIASTHSHAAMDYIGGWGGVPPWYMDQTARAIKDSIRQAYADRVPVTLEAGEVYARDYNSERRGGYRSAEDPSLNFVRAIDASGNVVATVATYAAHPTDGGQTDSGIAHADFPGIFAKVTEAEFGGVATLLQNGLGNISSRRPGGKVGQGTALADLLPPVGEAKPVDSTDVKVGRTYWDQPVTNIPLGTLGALGFFDHPFGGPATVDVGRQTINRCRSASAYSAHVSVTAAKIGGLWISAAPGEVFANFTNTIDEKAPIAALAIAQANDALGYMPQSFEMGFATSRQGAGFVDDSYFHEYEDAYAIDECFGDMALETTLSLFGQI
jgi:hypothetical protein